jgi:thiol-disulfide isomerase/thioredoxin
MRWFLLPLLALALAGCQQQPPPVSPAAPITPPAPLAEPERVQEEPAATITLEAVDQQAFEKVLASKRGQIVLVDVWATWCAPCKTAFKDTVALHEKYSPQGLAVVSLSLDDLDAHPEAMEFLKEQQASFTNLRSKLGADEAAFEQFDIDGGSLPHLKLYDREGKLVKKFVSGDPERVFRAEDVELAVRQLLLQ